MCYDLEMSRRNLGKILMVMVFFTLGSTSAGAFSVYGTITASRGESHIPVNVLSTQSVTFTVTTTSGTLSPLMVLRECNDTEITRNSSTITRELVAGNYFLEVARWSGTGTFMLSVQGPACALSSITIGQPATGTITDSGGEVNYLLSVPAAQTVTFTVAKTSGDLSPLMVLRNIDDSEITRGKSITQELGAGDYILEVAKYSGTGTFSVTSTDLVGIRQSDPTPVELELLQNAPNPFNPSTTIRFAVVQGSPVRLTIHNTAGQLVRTLIDGNTEAGAHEVVWDGLDENGRAVSSGAYFYRLTSAEGAMVRKMLLVR
mgnify:FL=1